MEKVIEELETKLKNSRMGAVENEASTLADISSHHLHLVRNMNLNSINGPVLCAFMILLNACLVTSFLHPMGILLRSSQPFSSIAEIVAILVFCGMSCLGFGFGFPSLISITSQKILAGLECGRVSAGKLYLSMSILCFLSGISLLIFTQSPIGGSVLAGFCHGLTLSLFLCATLARYLTSNSFMRVKYGKDEADFHGNMVSDFAVMAWIFFGVAIFGVFYHVIYLISLTVDWNLIHIGASILSCGFGLVLLFLQCCLPLEKMGSDGADEFSSSSLSLVSSIIRQISTLTNFLIFIIAFLIFFGFHSTFFLSRPDHHSWASLAVAFLGVLIGGVVGYVLLKLRNSKKDSPLTLNYGYALEIAMLVLFQLCPLLLPNAFFFPIPHTDLVMAGMFSLFQYVTVFMFMGWVFAESVFLELASWIAENPAESTMISLARVNYHATRDLFTQLITRLASLCLIIIVAYLLSWCTASILCPLISNQIFTITQALVQCLCVVPILFLARRFTQTRSLIPNCPCLD